MVLITYEQGLLLLLINDLLKILIKSSDGEKAALLETYKSDNLQILENLNKENTKDSIVKAIQKIREMAYSIDNIDDNIIALHELRKELL